MKISKSTPKWVLGLVASVLLFSANLTAQEDVVSSQQDPELKTIPQPAAKAALPTTQEETAAQDRPALQDKTDGKLIMNFKNTDWEDVINWYLEQNEYSIYWYADPPTGTFSYQDAEPQTPEQALDVLNNFLLMEEGRFSLVRYQKMLILVNEATGIPDVLVENVTPHELAKRSKYEILQCAFDITDLAETGIDQEIRKLISRIHADAFTILPSANTMTIRETGEKLRHIKNILDNAKKQETERKTQLSTYDIKHVEGQLLLDQIRQLMGISADQFMMEDGTFSFSHQPLSPTVYLKGIQRRIDEFNRIANLIDAPDTPDDGPTLERPFLKTYSISIDKDLAISVMDTMFDGDDVRMQQDPVTGSIAFLGRTKQHKQFIEYLAALSDSGEQHSVMQLRHIDADDMVMILQSLLKINPDDPAAKGPSLFADTVVNRITVYGTPMEVETVRSMIESHDVGATASDGPRTNQRYIPTTAMQSSLIMGQLPDMWGTVGRKNILNIVRAEGREDFNRRLRTRGASEYDEYEKQIQDLESQFKDRIDQENKSNDDSATPDQISPVPAKAGTSHAVPKSPFRTAAHTRNVGVTRCVSTRLTYYTSTRLPQDEDTTDEVGETSVERQKSSNYRPPKAFKSVDGAIVEIRETEYGIVLKSDDLDALDDLEYLIDDMMDQASENELPTIFYLNHRKAVDAKALLDELLGIGDGGGGGGGGGGLGGMMGGMLGNMVGGGGGDALGSLFGGGGGSSGAAGIELEGEVRIGTDVKFNTLIVSGATTNDLQTISELIDYVDAPEPPIDIDLLGNTYFVPVLHRDLTEVKAKIEEQLGELIKKEGGQGGGGAQEAQAQRQMIQAMQQLTQGKKAGAGTNQEAQFPKAVLGMDERTRSILVTGPKFIYLRVLQLVTELDIPDAANAKTEILAMPNTNVEAIAKILKARLDDKAEILIDGEEMAGGGSSGNGGTSSSGSKSSSSTPSSMQAGGNEAMRSALINAMRSQGRQGGGNTGRGGGNTGRGGAFGGRGGARGGGRGR